MGLLIAGLLLAGCEEEAPKDANLLSAANEGSLLAPTDITALLPYNGSVGSGSSYYLISGAPSAAVTVNLTALTADADLRLYSDALFTTQLACTPLPFTASESCLAAYNASGNLYVRVVNIDGGVITFTLGFPVVLINEGAPGAPLDITGLLPYGGQVADSGISYYLITGFAPGAGIVIDLFNLSSDVDLSTYTDSTFATLSCTAAAFGTTPEFCVEPADLSGNIYIQVNAFDPGGGTFQIDAAPAPVSEGTVGVPIDITGVTPYAGAVAPIGLSYYLLTGLTPGALVEVNISGLTRDVDLDVWSDAAFSVPECFSIRFGTRTDSCVAIANGSGQVYIQVNDFDGAGGTYTINFSLPPAPATEGTIPSPIVANFADLQHNGQVGASTQISYYQIVGLAPSTVYTVQLYNLTADADFTVYSTADFATTLECFDLQAGRTFESCLATSNGAGELYIRVQSNSAGSYFSLDAF